MRCNYILDITVIGTQDEILWDSKVRAKNKLSEFDAQSSFDNYCKRKFGNTFKRLIVRNCYVENELTDILNKINNELFK